MNIRESYASTHHASLAWSPEHERAIDRIAAAGFCGVGIVFLKARYGNVARSMLEGEKILREIYASRYEGDPSVIARRVARQCMREYLFDFCHVCLGAGERVEKKLRIVCSVCNGSRVRNYSDITRAHQMGLSLARTRLAAPKLQSLMDWVWTQDRLANAQLVVQLDRRSRIA